MHLVVIQHGLWGAPANTAYLSRLLDDKLGDGYHILNSDVNSGNLTYDGIDVCGDRLYSLVLKTFAKLADARKPVHAISMIGYSMGGLITRYVAGKLYAEGRFESITPVNFITVATPHLGAWRMPTSWYNRTFNYMVPVVTSRSGYQLVLQDKHLWGKPLLCLMSQPDLLFIRGLRAFRKLMIFANVFHDRPVPYCTAAIRLDNPYERNRPVPLDPSFPSIVTPSAKAASTSARGCCSRPKSSTSLEIDASKNAAITIEEVVEASPHLPLTVNVITPGSAPDGDDDVPITDPVRQIPSQPKPQPQSQSQHKKQQQLLSSAQHVEAHVEVHSTHHPPQPPPSRPQPVRPLRSSYLLLMLPLMVPLAVPALLYMVITGRVHHKKMLRTALDHSWIQHFHKGEFSDRKGPAKQADGSEGPRELVLQQGLMPDGAGSDNAALPQHEARPMRDIECPSAPDLLSQATAADVPTVVPGTTGASGGGANAVGAIGDSPTKSGGLLSAPGEAADVAAAAAASALDGDGADEVVVVSEQSVLLHDGIVELPAGLHRVQEWIAEKLNQLPWLKLDVDCRDLHAHAAIIMRNPSRFTHNRDVLDYLVLQFERA